MKTHWSFALLLITFALSGCQEIPHESEVYGEAQGTTYHIKLVLDNTSPSLDEIRSQVSEILTEIDLSSIAQGYSVGMVARLLEALGIRNYLVEIDGEMMVKGRKSNGDAWRVVIEKPTPFSQKVQKIIDAREQGGTAIMTTGTYRNFFDENGQAYSRILNLKTGRPVTHHLRSVTVMHDDPAWAEAWDTALLCMGEQKAAQIAEAEQLKVLLIYDSDNKLQEHMSKAFVTSQ